VLLLRMQLLLIGAIRQLLLLQQANANLCISYTLPVMPDGPDG